MSHEENSADNQIAPTQLEKFAAVTKVDVHGATNGRNHTMFLHLEP